MSLTHHNGQKLVDCPKCDGSIRVKALKAWDGDEREVHCDRCDTRFTTTRDEVTPDE